MTVHWLTAAAAATTCGDEGGGGGRGCDDDGGGDGGNGSGVAGSDGNCWDHTVPPPPVAPHRVGEGEPQSGAAARRRPARRRSRKRAVDMDRRGHGPAEAMRRRGGRRGAHRGGGGCARWSAWWLAGGDPRWGRYARDGCDGGPSAQSLLKGGEGGGGGWGGRAHWEVRLPPAAARCPSRRCPTVPTAVGGRCRPHHLSELCVCGVRGHLQLSRAGRRPGPSGRGEIPVHAPLPCLSQRPTPLWGFGDKVQRQGSGGHIRPKGESQGSGALGRGVGRLGGGQRGRPAPPPNFFSGFFVPRTKPAASIRLV